MKKTKEVEVADCCWKVSTLAVCWVTSSSCIIIIFFFSVKNHADQAEQLFLPVGRLAVFHIFLLLTSVYYSHTHTHTPCLFLLLTLLLWLAVRYYSTTRCAAVIAHAEGKTTPPSRMKALKPQIRLFVCVWKKKKNLFALWLLLLLSICQVQPTIFPIGWKYLFIFIIFEKESTMQREIRRWPFSRFIAVVCAAAGPSQARSAPFSKRRETRNQIGPSPVDGSKRFSLPHRPFLFFWQVYHQKVEEKGDLEEKKKHFRNLRNTFLPSVHFHVKTKKSGEKYKN